MRKTVDHTDWTSSGRNPSLVAHWCAPVMEPQARNVKLSLKVSERPTAGRVHRSDSEISLFSHLQWVVFINITLFASTSKLVIHARIFKNKQKQIETKENIYVALLISQLLEVSFVFLPQLKSPAMISTMTGRTGSVKHTKDQRTAWCGTAPVLVLVGARSAVPLQVRITSMLYTVQC